MVSELVAQLRARAELHRAWDKWELGDKPGPAPAHHNETAHALAEAADRIEALEADLARVTSPEYLTEALAKVGAVSGDDVREECAKRAGNYLMLKTPLDVERIIECEQAIRGLTP